MITPFYPPGCWPLQMTAKVAAAFCGEVSVEAFRRKVDRGEYPQPLHMRGSLQVWHRERLTATINERHGIEAPHEQEDIASLI